MLFVFSFSNSPERMQLTIVIRKHSQESGCIPNFFAAVVEMWFHIAYSGPKLAAQAVKS